MKKACMYCGHTKNLIRSYLHPGKWQCRSKKECDERTGGIGIKKK